MPTTTHLHSAYVTISGKVFVSQDEIDDLRDQADLDDERTFDEREAFEALARKKLAEMFYSDDPFKFNEIEIDLTSYRA